MLVFGAMGILAGMQTTRQSFAISVSLIKRRVPQTVQASETGQAFRPVDLNDATLLATLMASEPLDLTLKRLDNGIHPSIIRRFVEASQREGTDIFYITYHSPISPSDALEFSRVWAEEVSSYTKRLQQAEARDVRTILQREVTALEEQIDGISGEILAFSKENEFLGGNSQVAAVLGKLAQIELDLEAARASEASKKQQLENLIEQIGRQSPVELQLKVAREELASLRSTYTDENPLVLAKLQGIEYLEEQIRLLNKNEDAGLDSFTGTPLGDQIYLSIIALRNELLETGNRIHSLQNLRVQTSQRLSEFPAIVSGYDELQKKRDSHIEGLSLMRNRLKEAEIFASGAPGYWQVFQAPDARAIVPSSKLKKPALFGLAGSFLGASIAGFSGLLLGLRSPRRSVLECCIATRAPLLCDVTMEPEESAQEAIMKFWITHLAPRLDGSVTLLFWTGALEPEDERRFWLLLGNAAQRDTGKALEIVDLNPDALWGEGGPVTSIDWRAVTSSRLGDAGGALLRASSLPQHELRPILAKVEQWVAVVAADKDSLERAGDQREIVAAYLPQCDGTIAWTIQPAGRIEQMSGEISKFIAMRFS